MKVITIILVFVSRTCISKQGGKIMTNNEIIRLAETSMENNTLSMSFLSEKELNELNETIILLETFKV